MYSNSRSLPQALNRPEAEKIYIKTFGCQMNEYDSYRCRKLLQSLGYRRAETPSDATCIIINTCTVRKKAEDKVYSELGRIKKIKRTRPELLIGVGGCLAQQKGEEIIKKYPYVDFVFGTQALQRLPDIIRSSASGHKVVDITMSGSRTGYPDSAYTADAGQVTAFITVMQGCDNFCSYCIVPYVRGREWSRPVHAIKDEAQTLAANGVKEITLLGQNVNSYGNTCVPKKSFAELLYTLHSISGIERIRFVTSNPKDLSNELIDAMEQLDKVCEHIHLPLQSGSDTILKKMNRSYSAQRYRRLIEDLRSRLPGISITSDIIVGFPGESADDFNSTLSLIEEIGFDDLFVFHYTDRPGTAASKIPGKVPYSEKIKRLKAVNEMQRSISHTKNKELIGATVSVLFETVSGRTKNALAGRTRTNKTITCSAPREAIGTIHNVTVTGASIHALEGDMQRVRRSTLC